MWVHANELLTGDGALMSVARLAMVISQVILLSKPQDLIDKVACGGKMRQGAWFKITHLTLHLQSCEAACIAPGCKYVIMDNTPSASHL